MTSENILPDDIIQRIAADSYRAACLLSLTCKKYSKLLDNYCVLVPSYYYGVKLNSRSQIISALFYMIKSMSNFIEYRMHVTDGRVMRVDTVYQHNIQINILIKFHDNNRLVCEIVKGFDRDYLMIGKGVWIFGILCTIYEGADYQNRSMEYIRDNMPELHSAIDLVG